MYLILQLLVCYLYSYTRSGYVLPNDEVPAHCHYATLPISVVDPHGRKRAIGWTSCIS